MYPGYFGAYIEFICDGFRVRCRSYYMRTKRTYSVKSCNEPLANEVRPNHDQFFLNGGARSTKP
jgi:hypothetical protein